MSLINRVLGRITGRAALTTVGEDARRAAKLAKQAAEKSESLRSELRALAAVGVEARRAAKLAQQAVEKSDAMRRDLHTLVGELRNELAAVQAQQHKSQDRAEVIHRDVDARLLQYHLQLGRLARARHEDAAHEDDGRPALASREVPLSLEDGAALEWAAVGGGVTHPDPAGREWMALTACPVCGDSRFTVVNPWNKLLLLRKAPDAASIRYDYAICHGCGVLSAMRRPSGGRFTFLLEHFGEVTAKRGGDREIANRVLNPYPLSDADRADLRRLAAPGVFVSDHLGTKDYLSALQRDRFESSGHADVIGTLLQPRGARVLEIRARTGSLLDALRRHWGCDVYAMPIWESQQFLIGEVYGIPSSALIDFENFQVPFEGPFDLIVSQHMFTHVLRPVDFFAELRRRLKPGGYLYLHNEPDDEEFLDGKQSMIAMLNPLHMQAFDQGSLVRGLAANGFETVFLKRHSHTHICLARFTNPAMTPMDEPARLRRIADYERAYDRAILRMDEGVRARVADEWERTVARAVASGVADFDERGKLRLVAR